MRRWRNPPFRRGQFWKTPPPAVTGVSLPIRRSRRFTKATLLNRRGSFYPTPVAVVVTVTHPAPPQQVGHDVPRGMRLRQRGQFFPVVPAPVVVTVKVVPQPISHDAPRFLALPKRGRLPQPVVVTVAVAPQPIVRHARGLPFGRRGKFLAQPVPAIVTVTATPVPQPLSHDAPRFLPLPRRGRIAQPVPATVVVTTQALPPQSITARTRGRLGLSRRGRFEPVATTVHVSVSVPIGHDPIRLPFGRRGKFYPAVPATVTITPHPIVYPIPRARRGISFRTARGKFFSHLAAFVPFLHPPLNLGGTAVDHIINGTIVSATVYNGSVVSLTTYNGSHSTLLYNGTALVVDPQRNGTAAIIAINGTVSETSYNATEVAWGMIAANLTLGEFDDSSVNLAFTTSGGGALDLTSATVDVYLKTAAGVLDTDATTKHYSSTGGSPAITITNPTGGLATVQIPHADIVNNTLAFWKATVTIGGLRNTAMFGTVTTTLL